MSGSSLKILRVHAIVLLVNFASAFYCVGILLVNNGVVFAEIVVVEIFLISYPSIMFLNVCYLLLCEIVPIVIICFLLLLFCLCFLYTAYGKTSSAEFSSVDLTLDIPNSDTRTSGSATNFIYLN